MKRAFVIDLGIVCLLIVLGFLYWFGHSQTLAPAGPQACTQEAKQCPDGSYVGRTGPNCSFAPCPAASSSAQALAPDAYPLYSGVSWSAPVAATVENIAGAEISTLAATGTMNIAAVSQPFEQYYAHKLMQAGWSVDNALAAGGPGSDITAYAKGSDYIIVSLHTDFHGGAANEPVQCPCDVTLSVFSGSKQGS